MTTEPAYRVAAIVPCHNEEAGIAKVVSDLRENVPDITVFVYDNCSTDNTAEVAAQAGAVVREEPRKGKGNVIRRAFGDIDSDVYLLIDGDDTYDAGAAPLMIEKLLEGPYDHVLGVRKESEGEDTAYRPGHATGNRLLNRLVARVFGTDVGDMLSGYRAFSRRFVKSFPAASREFEIETELTVHCLALRIPSTSIDVGFKDRAPGSESKLRTYRDGSRILSIIVNLARHERPLAFYGIIATGFLLLAAALAAALVVGAVQNAGPLGWRGLTISLVLVLLGSVAMLAGMVMDGIRKARHEASRLRYLQNPAVPESRLAPETLPAPHAVISDGRHEERVRAS